MSVATLTIDTALKQIDSAVEKIINDKPQNFPEAANIGDAVRQGDVYIQLIDAVKGVPPMYRKLKTVEYPLQLAPGNTKGSRHCLENSPGAVVYVPAVDLLPVINNRSRNSTSEFVKMRKELEDEMLGYSQHLTGENAAEAKKWDSKTQLVSRAIEDAMAFFGPIVALSNPGVISHPEHGDWNLPAGTYRIVFQRTVDSDRRITRVLD